MTTSWEAGARGDSTPADNEVKREQFQKLLPGINVRTDGHQINASTRVQTGYWWVIFFPSHLPHAASRRPNTARGSRDGVDATLEAQLTDQDHAGRDLSGTTPPAASTETAIARSSELPIHT